MLWIILAFGLAGAFFMLVGAVTVLGWIKRGLARSLISAEEQRRARSVVSNPDPKRPT